MRARQELIEIAAETERILQAGRYHGPRGPVELAASLSRAVAGTVLHRPDDPLPAAPVRGASTRFESVRFESTRFEVTGETTLEAARRLVTAEPDTTEPDTTEPDRTEPDRTEPDRTEPDRTEPDRTEPDRISVACLNFASAKTPGGGFASGAQAQEESLARSSGLVACLRAVQEFYEFHRRQRDPLYSDHIVYSPSVPVFRDDSGALLPEPFHASFLTSPAPNACEAARQPDKRAQLPAVIHTRAARVLAVAAANGHHRLVLGAWGCGVFGNDPEVVAGAFARHLLPGGEFTGRFEHVVFAVLDHAAGTPTRAVFERMITARSA